MMRTYLVGDLQLLSLTNIRALAHGALEAVEGLVVELLGRGDDHLDLALGGGHELAELGADALQDGEAVVLGQGLEEVLDRLVVGGHGGGLFELLNDLVLVRGGEGGRVQDRGELGVLCEDGGQGGEGLGRRVEAGGLGCCGVL